MNKTSERVVDHLLESLRADVEKLDLKRREHLAKHEYFEADQIDRQKSELYSAYESKLRRVVPDQFRKFHYADRGRYYRNCRLV